MGLQLTLVCRGFTTDTRLSWVYNRHTPVVGLQLTLVCRVFTTDTRLSWVYN